MKRLLAALLMAAALPAQGAERRCGWLDNPTPANWTLTDRDGRWLLVSQSGYEARGLENMPDMTGRSWVVTNGGSHGYGCACLSVTVDHQSKRIIRVTSSEQLQLARCRSDPALPRR